MTKEERKSIISQYTKAGHGSTIELIDEINAHYAEGQLGNQKTLEKLLDKEPSLKDKILSFFKKASADTEDERLSKKSKAFYKTYKKMFDQFAEQNYQGNTMENTVTNMKRENMHVTEETGKRYAIPVGNEIINARTVTEQEVRTLLKNAYEKRYRDGSYIPVRVNTPSVLIEAAQDLGKSIADLPIILNVGKARQMMSSQAEWTMEQKHGRAHEFTIDDVVALVRAMNKPKQIIYQSEDERYVEIVEFQTEAKQKAIVVLEIGESKKSEYLNGYESGFYQILVTAFEPDEGYIDSLTIKKGNIKVFPQNKKGNSQSGSGNRVPSHLNESPFANSITENAEKINSSDENYSKNPPKKRFALSKDIETKVVHGYTLNKNANVNEDLLEELRIYDPSAEVSADGRVTVYHRTNKEGADKIRKTGIMIAKEDALFFSSKSEGYASDYGDTVLTFKIPSTKLRVNDIFDGEIHFDMPLKRSANGWSADVRTFLADDGIRYSLPLEKAIDLEYNEYTEKQYNDFGWARANEVLNEGQNKDFTSKFAEAVNGSRAFQKSKSGEFMIPVSDVYDKTFNGVNNTIVFAKGKIDEPVITRVLQIDEFEETILDEIRRTIYANERRGVQRKAGDIFRFYTSSNFGTYEWYKEHSLQSIGHNNRFGTDRGTSSTETDGIEEFTQVNKRFALPYSAPTSESLTTKVEQAYKPKFKDKTFTGWTASQIAFTNAQAGLEKVGKMLGVDNIEALVQAARSATNQADEMLVGNQRRIGVEGEKVYQGEGLEKILRPIKSRGDEYTEVFFDYLFNYHNVNRMNLEAISIARNKAKQKLLAKNQTEIAKLTSQREGLVEKGKLYLMQRKRLTLKLID